MNNESGDALNMDDSNTRYSRVAILLHWAIAVLILANLVVGFLMEDLKGTLRNTALNFHYSSGLTVLLLTAVRVIWRLTHTPPPHAASMKPWERHAAALGHFALYLVMVVMPLIGWSVISANPPIGSAGAKAVLSGELGAKVDAADVRRASRKAPRMIWGVVELPEIGILQRTGETPDGIRVQRVVHDELVEWHKVGGYVTIALLLLHILGALKHQLIDGEAELARMGMGRTRR
jgi:cytochrome b561